MEIKGIDGLDVGMSNIEIEGKVTYSMAPRFVEGDNEKGHYEFYSQFIVIDDGTGKIGCSVTIEKEEYKLENGVVARVKGKLESYKDKKGQMVKKIQGKLIAISKGDKVTDVQQEVAEEYFDEKAKEEKITPIAKPTAKVESNVWEAKDLRIARECAVKAVTELVSAKIMKSKDFFNFADTIVKYIYNGLPDKPKGKSKEAPKKATKEEKIALARHITGGKKLELREGSSGLFPDEKEELGSSPDNAIPFKGKKKALKKVSKGEDFVNEEDYIDPADLPI